MEELAWKGSLDYQGGLSSGREKIFKLARNASLVTSEIKREGKEE